MPYRPTFKYLSGEGKRNRTNADLFHALLCIAWGEDCAVITGHHVSFMFDGDLSTEDEVPSADCLLFDHEVMREVFPADYRDILGKLAQMERWERENFVRALVCDRYPHMNLDRANRYAPEPHVLELG